MLANGVSCLPRENHDKLPLPWPDHTPFTGPAFRLEARPLYRVYNFGDGTVTVRPRSALRAELGAQLFIKRELRPTKRRPTKRGQSVNLGKMGSTGWRSPEKIDAVHAPESSRPIRRRCLSPP